MRMIRMHSCTGNTGEDEPSKILDKMYEERNGIFRKAILAFREVIRDGYRFHEPSDAEQIIVRKWLSYNLLPAQSVLSGHTSYGMKHILESRTGIYMTNNQFKEAMMECGFFPVVVDELNWRFRIKKSSPMFTI